MGSRVLSRLGSRNSVNLVKNVLPGRFYSRQENYGRSMFPDVSIPDVNIVQYVLKDAGLWPNKIAVECGITGKKFTYDELRAKAEILSKSLRKIFGLKRGDVVALFLPNSPEYALSMLGIIQAGLIVTTINPTYTSDELQRQLLDSNTKLIITSNHQWSVAKDALEKIKRKIPTVIVKMQKDESIPNGLTNFQELLEVKCDIPDVEPWMGDDTLFLPYSSGTTGLPKGVMLTNKNLVTNVVQYHAPSIKYTTNTTESHQDVMSLVLPMYHITGFTICTLALLHSGCKLVTLPQFTPASFIKTLIDHQPNILKLVPTLVIFLYSHPSVKSEYFKNLSTIFSGAAPLGKTDEEKFREKVGKPINITQGYGLTETSPGVMMTPLCLQGKSPGAIGHPVSNTLVKVVNIDDPEMKHLGPNQVGELLVKGPQVMKGYLNRPEETSKAFADGWFKTGDMVWYDENEMFFVADRIKELIKVKGFQVAPAELEEVIRNYPGVAEAGVIGIPHDYSGEVPRAYVVAKSGAKIDAEKLQEYVQSKVAPHKKLSGGVVVVPDLPKNPSGKILRIQLKEKFKKEGI